MEGEIIVVSLIGTIGTVITIQLLNHNWFKRQDHRLDNEIKMKELEYKHKKSMKRLGITSKKGPSAGGFNLETLRGIWSNLDDDHKDALIDVFLEQGYTVPTEGGQQQGIKFEE
jgi:hypothetical protein